MDDVEKPVEEWLQQVAPWNSLVIPRLDTNKGEIHHAFIAHSDDDEDVDFSTQLYYTLKHLGFNVYLSEQEMKGEDMFGSFCQALQGSRRILALQTANAIRKADDTNDGTDNNEFRFHLGAACCRMVNEGRVLTIPILKGTKERDIPITAKFGNYVDYSRDPSTWFKDLCDLLIAKGEFLGDVFPITNIGEGAAWTYINGYLKVIHKFVADTVISWCKRTSIHRPLPIPETEVSLKLFVVIPKSGHLPATFADVDPDFEDIEGLTVTKTTRAGDKDRKYTTSMHRVKDTDGKWYIFTGEFASAMKSMQETMLSDMTTLKSSNFDTQVQTFANTLELLSKYTQTKLVADALHILHYIDQGDGKESLKELVLDRIKREIHHRSPEMTAHYCL